MVDSMFYVKSVLYNVISFFKSNRYVVWVSIFCSKSLIFPPFLYSVIGSAIRPGAILHFLQLGTSSWAGKRALPTQRSPTTAGRRVLSPTTPVTDHVKPSKAM